MRPVCPVCGRTHWKLGACVAPGPSFPPETPARAEVPREQLWAVIDAARAFLSRARGGHAGGKFWEAGADRLELELQRLPEDCLR